MKQLYLLAELPSRTERRRRDLDAQLARGPLRVQSSWRVAQTQRLAKRVRSQRRQRLLIRLALLGLAGAALGEVIFNQLH